jgi:HK97 family phage prohead protease
MAEHQRGRFPIGKAVEFEDAPTGLDASFYVAPTAAGEEALQLIRSGVVDSFSVAFRPIRDRRDSNGAIVRLEAALQEVSLVGSAAFPDAVVVGVRDSSGRAPIPIELARCQLQLLRSW